MAANKITNRLKFKTYSNKYVIKEIDKYFNCEEQDIELLSFDVIGKEDETANINLLIRINNYTLALKKHCSAKYINRLKLGDAKTSDETKIVMIKDLIGNNAFQICKMLDME